MQPLSLTPRAGLLGLLDQFIGPGATPGEIALQLLPAIVAMVAAPVYGSLFICSHTRGGMVSLAFFLKALS